MDNPLDTSRLQGTSWEKAVQDALTGMAEADVMARIWRHDHTVWSDSPEEISNRLGWLTIAERMVDNLNDIQRLFDAVKAEGYTHVLLLGMGGSSLAPEVFSLVFDDADGLALAVLDSTDPGAVLAHEAELPLDKTLFVVATKSGGTVETLSGFKYFYNKVADQVGADKTGAHFVAITDPGSKLVDLAQKYQFRATFENDPNIGGRYSVLSYFGLLPAQLVGVDVGRLIERATAAMTASGSDVPPGDSPGAILGAIMGVMAVAGRDKLTLLASHAIQPFGDWVEQLIAESTGKSGMGIVPVVGESTAGPEAYGDDRLFVYLRLADDSTYDGEVKALSEAGQPVITIQLADRYDLGGQFFLWEMATVVAGHLMGIQPFNQPNVESAKVRAREMVDEYTVKGALPAQTPTLSDGGIDVYGDVSAKTASDALRDFLAQSSDGDYVSVQAYVQPSEATSGVLRALQTAIRDRTRRATTLGYGPRFLHSTGQLHKGDGGNGLFIQITSDHPQDAAIPDTAGDDASAMSFGVLIDAQALGDRQALLDEGRRVIRFHVGGDVVAGVTRLVEALN